MKNFPEFKVGDILRYRGVGELTYTMTFDKKVLKEWWYEDRVLTQSEFVRVSFDNCMFLEQDTFIPEAVKILADGKVGWVFMRIPGLFQLSPLGDKK